MRFLDLESTPECVKTFGDVEMGQMYFAHGKDVQFAGAEGGLCWLNSARPQIHVHSEPQYVTLFGNRVLQM